MKKGNPGLILEVFEQNRDVPLRAREVAPIVGLTARNVGQIISANLSKHIKVIGEERGNTKVYELI